MRTDYIYTNILATKEYPHNVIRDYEIMLKDNTVNVEHIGEFLSNLYWENKYVTPDQLKSQCPKIDDPENLPNIDINGLIKNYNAIYD